MYFSASNHGQHKIMSNCCCSIPIIPVKGIKNETYERVSGAFAKLSSSRLPVCPSVGIEQLHSHWADFQKILN
jgi:hypothetical protein